MSVNYTAIKLRDVCKYFIFFFQFSFLFLINNIIFLIIKYIWLFSFFFFYRSLSFNSLETNCYLHSQTKTSSSVTILNAYWSYFEKDICCWLIIQFNNFMNNAHIFISQYALTSNILERDYQAIILFVLNGAVKDNL